MPRHDTEARPLVLGRPIEAEPSSAVVLAFGLGHRKGDVVFVTGDGVDAAVDQGFIRLLDDGPTSPAPTPSPPATPTPTAESRPSTTPYPADELAPQDDGGAGAPEAPPADEVPPASPSPVAPSDPEGSDVDLEALTGDELRALAKSRGVAVRGSKTAILERLQSPSTEGGS